MLAKKYSIHIISGVSVRRYVPLLLSSRCAWISSTGGWRLYFAGWVQFLGDVPHWEKFSRLCLRLAALTWVLGKPKPGFNGTVTTILGRRFSRTLAKQLKIFFFLSWVAFKGWNLVFEGIPVCCHCIGVVFLFTCCGSFCWLFCNKTGSNLLHCPRCYLLAHLDSILSPTVSAWSCLHAPTL